MNTIFDVIVVGTSHAGLSVLIESNHSIHHFDLVFTSNL